ncbi:MAG: DUF4446 family protein [bacterium]
MTLEIYILSGLIFLFSLLVFWIIRLEVKLSRLLSGKSKTLDESIGDIQKNISSLEDFQTNTESRLKILDKKALRAISGIETIRFNPYKGVGVGGNQSFVTALVNENGDGVVISTLYSREHTSIFSKPIKKNSSSYEMTAEEKDALDKAYESTKTIK